MESWWVWKLRTYLVARSIVEGKKPNSFPFIGVEKFSPTLPFSGCKLLLLLLLGFLFGPCFITVYWMLSGSRAKWIDNFSFSQNHTHLCWRESFITQRSWALIIDGCSSWIKLLFLSPQKGNAYILCKQRSVWMLIWWQERQNVAEMAGYISKIHTPLSTV